MYRRSRTGAGRYSTNLLQVIDRGPGGKAGNAVSRRGRDAGRTHGRAGDDSDETVIMAPVVKHGKRVQKPAAPSETLQPLTEPVVNVDVEVGQSQTASSAVESPRLAAGRRQVLPKPPASAPPPPRVARR